MKYVITWAYRLSGSAADNDLTIARIHEAFTKWTPSSDITFLQFLGYVEADGGAAVVETDSPLSLAREIAKFTPYLDYRVMPAVEIADAAAFVQEGIEFRASVFQPGALPADPAAGPSRKEDLPGVLNQVTILTAG